MEEEIWKTIQDFPNYEVSSFGNVRNRLSNHLMKLQTARFPAEGELYIWPGFIEHEVTTNLTEDQTRISISFCLDWAD
jgi:hypothetical protein